MQAQDEAGGYQATIGTTARFIGWTLAWVVTLAVAKFGPRLAWDAQLTVASWVAVGANVLVGIGWVVAFAQMLRAMDDLQRKILQDALTVTLGAGWVIGFAFVVADAAGLVPFDVDIAVFPVLLSVVYVLAFAVGKLRYR